MRISAWKRTLRGGVCALLLHAILGSGPAMADKWVLQYNKGGIRIESRPVATFKSRETRATVDVPTPLAQILRTFEDANQLTHWVARCHYAEVIARGDNWARLYLRLSMPALMKDRDLVIIQRRHHHSPKQVIYTARTVFDTQNVPAPTKQHIRVPWMRARWTFDAIDSHSTKITYKSHIDPGGRLPKLVLRRGEVELPLNTLQGLIALVTEGATPGA